MIKTKQENVEIQKLKKEYDDFCGKNYFGAGLAKLLYSQIFFLLFIWILPENILSALPFLHHFADFMIGIFPNIEIYANASYIPELTTFYLSYSWVICVIFCILIFYNLPKIAKQARKFFGTKEFENKGVFLLKYIPVLETEFKFYNKLKFLGSILFFLYGWYIVFTGGGFTSLFGSGKFGVFIIGLSQNLILTSVFLGLAFYLNAWLNFKLLKKLKKEKN